MMAALVTLFVYRWRVIIRSYNIHLTFLILAPMGAAPLYVAQGNG